MNVFAETEIVFWNYGDPPPEDQLARWEGDWILSMKNDLVLSDEILRKARKGAINFHPAPPHYRGLGGYFYAIHNGDTAVEELLTWDEPHHTYHYRFVSGGLPVTHYESTLEVKSRPDNKGSVIVWSSNYIAHGVSPAEAKTIIDGIYESGVSALAGD